MTMPDKAATRAQWHQAAAGWNAHGPLIRSWLARATEGLLGMAGAGAGMRVLDVAVGAGDQTLSIAERLGPAGEVLASDLSPAILAPARDNTTRRPRQRANAGGRWRGPARRGSQLRCGRVPSWPDAPCRPVAWPARNASRAVPRRGWLSISTTPAGRVGPTELLLTAGRRAGPLAPTTRR